MNYSDEEIPTTSKKTKVAPKKLRKAPGKVYKQEVDTNVFKIALSTLKNQAELASGDPVICKNCKAIFNQFSVIEEKKTLEGEELQMWTCEFCNTQQEVSLEKEELPKTAEVNYIMEAVAQANQGK